MILGGFSKRKCKSKQNYLLLYVIIKCFEMSMSTFYSLPPSTDKRSGLEKKTFIAIGILVLDRIKQPKHNHFSFPCFFLYTTWLPLQSLIICKVLISHIARKFMLRFTRTIHLAKLGFDPHFRPSSFKAIIYESWTLSSLIVAHELFIPCFFLI